MKRLIFGLLLWALVLSPTPKREPPVQCTACWTWNEPNNRRCISCKALL